jgi:hypothetical protein
LYFQSERQTKQDHGNKACTLSDINRFKIDFKR